MTAGLKDDIADSLDYGFSAYKRFYFCLLIAVFISCFVMLFGWMKLAMNINQLHTDNDELDMFVAQRYFAELEEHRHSGDIDEEKWQAIRDMDEMQRSLRLLRQSSIQ